jgi:Ca2+-binding RTX toxin-like protein
MIGRASILVGVSLALTMICSSGEPSLAAGTTVPLGHVGRVSRPIATADLTPVACNNGTPVNRIAGSGVVTGTNQSDLVLGSTSVDSMDGRQQNDCIVGGDGDDVIDGFNGTDVCIGGSGIDVFVRCETAIQ